MWMSVLLNSHFFLQKKGEKKQRSNQRQLRNYVLGIITQTHALAYTGTTVSSPSNLEASSAVCLWQSICLELEPHVTAQFNSRHRNIPGISRPPHSSVNDIQTLSSFLITHPTRFAWHDAWERLIGQLWQPHFCHWISSWRQRTLSSSVISRVSQLTDTNAIRWFEFAHFEINRWSPEVCLTIFWKFE